MAEEISAAAMDEVPNPSEVIESETPPPDQPMESTENLETNGDENVENDENQENLGEDGEIQDGSTEKVDAGDGENEQEKGLYSSIIYTQLITNYFSRLW